MKTHTIKAELPDLPKAGEGMKWAEVEYRIPYRPGIVFNYDTIQWDNVTIDFTTNHPTTRLISMTQSDIDEAQKLEKLEDKRLNLIDKCKKTEGKISAINSKINILRKAQL